MAQRDYEGDGVVIHWDSERCFHSGRCVRGLPEVFDFDRRPWVVPTADTAGAIATLIDTCPSGALSYTRTDGVANGRRGRAADDDPAASVEADADWAAPPPTPKSAPQRPLAPDDRRTTAERSDQVAQWGPLWTLVGDWAGDVGVDVSYSHHQHAVIETPFREEASFTPFGPVNNGRQRLFGLDHRSAMWRMDESVPFHREVGYWLWDPDDGTVLRSFAVARGIAILAVGAATIDSTELTLTSKLGSAEHGISQSSFLHTNASSTDYRVDLRIDPDSWSYAQTTTLELPALDGPLAHTDANTLHRVVDL